MPNRFPAIVTYSARFREALGVLCTETPALDMCRAWLDTDDENLQEWVLNHARLDWAQGIGVIDCARGLADAPEEGCPEHVSLGVERLLRAVAASPLPSRIRGKRPVPKKMPAGVSEDDFWEAWCTNMLTTNAAGEIQFTHYYDFDSVTETPAESS